MRTFVPSVLISCLTLVSALPWGLPPDGRFVLPLMPIAAIHFWAVRDDARLVEWFVFLAGLTLDVLSNGPLGFWSAIYLGAYALSVLAAGSVRGVRLGRWLSLVGVMTVLALMEWALSSLYYFEFADLWPLALGSIAVVLFYPILAGALRFLDPEMMSSANPGLTAGGRN